MIRRRRIQNKKQKPKQNTQDDFVLPEFQQIVPINMHPRNSEQGTTFRERQQNLIKKHNRKPKGKK